MIKRRFSSIIALTFIAVFVAYFVRNAHSFKPLLEVSLISLIAAALTKMLLNLVNGYFMKWTVEVFTPRLPLRETVYIAILSGIGNFFGPLLGGAAIRATYLKKVHNLSYSLFASTLAGYYVILFAANSVLAIVSILFLHASSYAFSLIIFFGVWLAAMIVMMAIRLPRRERFGRLESKNGIARFCLTVLYDIDTGWRTLLKKKGLVPRLLFLAACGFLITFVTGLIEFRAVSVPITLAGLGLYTAVVTCSMLVSLTPGALGIRESLLLLTSSVMGVGHAQILQVSVIDRGLTFFMLGILYLMTHWFKPKAIEGLFDKPAGN